MKIIRKIIYSIALLAVGTLFYGFVIEIYGHGIFGVLATMIIILPMIFIWSKPRESNKPRISSAEWVRNLWKSIKSDPIVMLIFIALIVVTLILVFGA